MDWIKRNLMLVVGGVVALVLLVAASLYLVMGRAEHQRVTMELEAAKADLQRLYSASPSPIDENVKLVVEDQARLAKLLGDARSRFAAPVLEPQGDIASFKKLLDNTIYELTKEAEMSKVRLPERYNFTFEVQKSAVSFASGSIVPLSARLAEVKGICRILYGAGVHSIDGMRRVIVSPDDREGSADYLLQKPSTNDVTKMVKFPYEVTFTGFSQELAAVMDGLAAASEFIVVRDVWVTPAPVVAAIQPAVTPGVFLGGFIGGRPVAPAMADPCAGNCAPCTDCCCCAPKPARPTFTQPTFQPRVVFAPRPVVPNTILNERLLRFTVMFEVVVPVSAATSVAPASIPVAAPVIPPEE